MEPLQSQHLTRMVKFFVNYAEENQCADLKQTREHIEHVEEDSENTNHLNSHISNSILKKLRLKRLFYYLAHI